MSQPANRQVSQLPISELDAEIVRYDSLLKQQERTTAEIRNQLGLLRSEMDRRARGALEPRLSDHALIRFMERAMGFDIEAIKARILTSEREKRFARKIKSEKAEDGPSLQEGLAEYFDDFANEVVR